ncbi:MAG TPA: hypothetical protein DCX03_10080 [Bacteroidales bacterium]|nr:hypothetical protein [Bacteroidales bacterium]
MIGKFYVNHYQNVEMEQNRLFKVNFERANLEIYRLIRKSSLNQQFQMLFVEVIFVDLYSCVCDKIFFKSRA